MGKLWEAATARVEPSSQYHCFDSLITRLDHEKQPLGYRCNGLGLVVYHICQVAAIPYYVARGERNVIDV